MDVFVALILPGLAIFAVVFGPQRTWIILLLVGLLELAVAFPALRCSKSCVSGWLAVVAGILILALGVRFALTPW
jgi:hypothetical protein